LAADLRGQARIKTGNWEFVFISLLVLSAFIRKSAANAFAFGASSGRRYLPKCRQQTYYLNEQPSVHRSQ